MKLFWTEKEVWLKAQNIIQLYRKHFSIPTTIIIQSDNFSYFDFSILKDKQVYILRPSYKWEDSINTSTAGYYKSLVFKNKNELITFFKSNNNNLWKELWWTNSTLLSVIVQEFIEAEFYWVYFTRSPNNILQEWFYEIWTKFNSVTSNKEKWTIKLNFFDKKKLEIEGRKIEKFCNAPQDIEFCISKWKIIFLQTRDITTWNNTIYSFWEIMKFTWIYKKLDFDELWNVQDYFSYKLLNKLFPSIYINWNIYFKKKIIPSYLFKNINSSDKNLDIFYSQYKKYLQKKIIFKILKFIIPQKIDKNVLTKLFKEYSYSFHLNQKSNTNLNFSYNTNYITKKLLDLEKSKQQSFISLEKYKQQYQGKNFYWEVSKNLNSTIVFIKWKLIQKKYIKKDFTWIYKWTIEWIITPINNIKKNTSQKQVLIANSLDFRIYELLPYIEWVIIEWWNQLSHNSIVLREYKIPSIIQYKNFQQLVPWKWIIIEN